MFGTKFNHDFGKIVNQDVQLILLVKQLCLLVMKKEDEMIDAIQKPIIKKLKTQVMLNIRT